MFDLERTEAYRHTDADPQAEDPGDNFFNANRGMAFVLDTNSTKEFALAHWLVGGASGGRLFVRVFDGSSNVREDIARYVLASITTIGWNEPAKGWDAGAPKDDANFNRRQPIRVGAAVAHAQVAVIGFDGPIDLQSLRLYGLPEVAPPVLNETPLLTGIPFGSGRREFAAEVSWDLPSLAPGATSLLDVTVNGTWAGRPAGPGGVARLATARSRRRPHPDRPRRLYPRRSHRPAALGMTPCRPCCPGSTSPIAPPASPPRWRRSALGCATC